MFEKLNEIVKESESVFFKSNFNEKAKKDAINEATGVIFDVLKSQLDTGKASDLMNYFKTKHTNIQWITKLMVNKYSSRLNRYFNLSINEAREISEQLIPVVVGKFVAQTMNDKKQDNGLFTLMNWLSGNTVNFEAFFARLNVAKIA